MSCGEKGKVFLLLISRYRHNFIIITCIEISLGYCFLVDPGIDGMIILTRIFRKWDVGGMDWIQLAEDRDRW
jgi:hypothetical protein